MDDAPPEDFDEPPRGWEDAFHEPLGALVQALTAVDTVVGSEAVGVEFRVERMELGLPIELRERVDEEGRVTLRSAPPTQQIDTTVFPVLHQLRIGLFVDEDDGDGGG